MFKVLSRLALVIGTMLFPSFLQGDSIRFVSGRVADGPVVEMKLTAAQSTLIEKHFTPGMKVLLTNSQRNQIRKQANLKVAPTKIQVFHPAEIEHDCTCASSNLASPFKAGWVEMPVRLLCSDSQAKAKEITD